MKTVVEIVVGIVIPVLTLAAVGIVFVWAARKDGEADQAVQKRLGIKRKTRLGR
jgi:NADH:ubiquinone oxidoreductase subunit H